MISFTSKTKNKKRNFKKPQQMVVSQVQKVLSQQNQEIIVMVKG